MSWLLDKLQQAHNARLKNANAVPASEASEPYTTAAPADAGVEPDTLASAAVRLTGETVEPHRPDDVLAHEFVVKSGEGESAQPHAADERAQVEETKRSAKTGASTDSGTHEHSALAATPEEHARARTRTAEVAAANAQKKAESDRKRKNREESRMESERALASASLARVRAEPLPQRNRAPGLRWKPRGLRASGLEPTTTPSRLRASGFSRKPSSGR